MLITNGSCTRTVKPGDYESRSVTLAFGLEPDDDVEVCVHRVMEMCERQASGKAPVTVAAVPPTPKRSTAATAPVPASAPITTTKTAVEAVDEAGPTGSTTEPSAPVVKTAEAASADASGSTARAGTAQEVAPSATGNDPTLTDPALIELCGQTSARLGGPTNGAGERIKELIVKFNGGRKATAVSAIPPEARPAFVAEMKALKPL
jgi:hypothetical protein